MVNAALVLAITIISFYKMKTSHTVILKQWTYILCLKTKMDIISTKLGRENLQKDSWDTEIRGLPLETGLGMGSVLYTLYFQEWLDL